jgi:glycosyltransferase involved in cell wall biosynthesis
VSLTSRRTRAAATIRTGEFGAARRVGDDAPLRIALLTYRGNPRCGGQGVYVRHLSRALIALGHDVEVLSGQPYPELDPGVRLRPIPSLDLYRRDDPFRTPRLGEFRDAIDVTEFALMCTAGFPEPLTFSLRAWRHLRSRAAEVDVVHDNQGLGYGLLPLLRSDLPLIASIHHPIQVDRDLELAVATSWRRRLALRRWYGFAAMQQRVARRIPRIITVSESSRRDMVDAMGIDPSRVVAIPLGVDADRYRPLPEVRRVPGRLVTTTSADVPLKGLGSLVAALRRVRDLRPDAHLVVVGSPRPESSVGRLVDQLGLHQAIQFTGPISEARLIELYAEAEVAVVPSLYEGFSLPAIEAMACGVPLVATTGGALPEVAGEHGESALLVPPGDVARLGAALSLLLDDPGLRARLAASGRQRAVGRYTWEAAAAATVAEYRRAIAAKAARR